MFIVTDDVLINTDQITTAIYTPETKASDVEDFGVDENGMYPPKLTVYFPASCGEDDLGNPYVELTGEAADKTWALLRDCHAAVIVKAPSRKQIDYAARDRKREEARRAQAAAAGVEYDLPF